MKEPRDQQTNPLLPDHHPAPPATKPPPSARALWLRRGLGLGLGATAGFAYYTFVGCTSGGCPIWQDPFISTGFGALLGSLVVW